MDADVIINRCMYVVGILLAHLILRWMLLNLARLDAHHMHTHTTSQVGMMHIDLHFVQ